ncbi:MAG: ABC transporter permease subunit [Holosporales bacterium]|jgi:putrescine transport system permease protein|nr:ABC transporter permease subunit [Holosporales bacterium]
MKINIFSWKHFAILPTLLIALLIIMPLLIIFRISFSYADFSMPPFSQIFSWTSENLLTIKLNMKNYIMIIQNAYYAKTFLKSIELGGITTILCLTLGFAMAYGIHNAKERFKNILLVFVSLSFWTSFLIRIYAWINLLSTHGIVNSILMYLGIIKLPIHFLGNYYSVVLGLVFCYLPFMIFPIYTNLHKLDKSYIEAAFDLGASPLKIFWRITIPLTKQGIINGCLLVFTGSISEFIIPELLGGSDTNMFGRVIWNEFFINLDWPIACALSIVMITFVILPVFLFQGKAKTS